MIIIKKLKCFLFGHEWTCKAQKGVLPSSKELFNDYAKMFCDRCGKFSKLNSRLDL